MQQRDALLREFEALRDVSGFPAIVVFEGELLTINYELFRRFLRSLRGHHVSMRIERHCLRIDYAKFPVTHGTIELYGLPAYQTRLLTDLPLVRLEG